MKHALVLLAAGGLFGNVLAAEPPPVAAPPATPPIDVSASVARGIDFFRGQAATNEAGWLFLPIEGAFQQVIGWKTNSVHFKEVQITIPGYDLEDPYEVLVPGPSPADPMIRQTRWRTVRPNPSKDRKETREVPDAKGTIIHEIAYPIWDKDIGDRWRYGSLGNNALAVLALKRCGVSANDPLIYQPANNLARVINMFGFPDTTHDLAWLTAGFAVMPGDEFKRLTEACAAKLLDGQITTGPAAGLWGPVSINTAMCSAMIKAFGKWGDEKKVLERELAEEQAKRVKGKQTARATHLEEDLAKLTDRITELQDNSSRIAQLGMLMFDIFGRYQYGMENWGRRVFTFQAERFSVESLPYVIQNQISADLESTSLALFALRVAFENGRLPSRTWRPDGPKAAAAPSKGPALPSALPPVPPPPSEFPPPRETRDVITLAAKALTAARPANGQWPELNLHQRVTDYLWLKSVPQIASNEVLKLPQPVTLASVCQGAAALANLQIMQTGKTGPTALETESCRPMIHDLIAGKLVLTNIDVRVPYDALLQLTAPRTKAGKPLRTDYTDWNELAKWVIHQQNDTGEWGGEKAWVMMPSTSLLAMRQVLKDIKDDDIIKMYDKPHLTPAMFVKYNITRYGAPEASYFTAAALLFLADGMPVAPVPEKPAPKP